MAQSTEPRSKRMSDSDWREWLGPLGGVLRVDWIEAVRVARQTFQTGPAEAAPASLPRGVTTVAGPGARLDWLRERALRGALGGRIVEIYFRQILGDEASIRPDLGVARFRFDGSRDLLRWNPSRAVPVSSEARQALGALYEGLFGEETSRMADALVALGISRDRSDTRTDEAIAALRAHFAGVSLRAVDFRRVNLLSTWWRLSSAAGRHGSRIAPELVAVALMLSTMTQTLRSLRATVDVGGAYRRARNG
jgi:hypothetical protein